jgi:hypothetical protein
MGREIKRRRPTYFLSVTKSACALSGASRRQLYRGSLLAGVAPEARTSGQYPQNFVPSGWKYYS